ncbi:MAG: type II secretion system protein [Planctomycetes bacterium]|nr:type II secretion system protein [Planctomycetota bacterium]
MMATLMNFRPYDQLVPCGNTEIPSAISAKSSLMNRSDPTAFSLVELIILLTFFAILISLAIPYTQKSLSLGYIEKCKQNFNSLGQAMQAYTEDFSGYFPPNNQAFVRKNKNLLHISWDDLLGSAGYDGRHISREEMEAPYAQTPSPLYECPLQKNKSEYHQLRSAVMNCRKDTINMGGMGDRFNYRGLSVSIREVPAPSETILLLELESELGNGYTAGRDRVNSQMDYRTHWPQKVHLFKFMYLFCDGHAEVLFPEDTVNNKLRGKYWSRNPDD